MRRHARHASRRRPAGLPSLRPPRAGARALRRLRLGLDRAPRHRHRAPGVRARGDRLPPRRRGGRSRSRARRLRAGAARRARRHADGGQGPRLPRRRPRRGARRRRHAALPRLPRRGAHVRARHPAGGPRRARSRAADACSCRPWRPDAPSIRFAARHDADGFLAGELERRARAALSAVLDTDPRGLLLAASPERRWPPRRRSASACATRSARRRCSACAAASARRSWSRRRTARRAVAEVGAAVQAAAGDRAHKAAAFSVDVDPQ